MGVVIVIIGIIWYLTNKKLNTLQDLKVLLNDITGIIYYIALLIYFSYMLRQSNSGVVFTILFVLTFVFYISYRLYLRAMGKDKIEDQDNGLIYVRNKEVPYSPAVLSYFVRRKLDSSKDLTTTIINLFAKKAIKSDEYGVSSIYVKGKSEPLTYDERYIYKCLIKKTTFNEKLWEKLVMKNFNKFNFMHDKQKDEDKNHLVVESVLLLISGLVGVATNVEFFKIVCLLGIIAVIIYLNNVQVKKQDLLYTKEGETEVFKWSNFRQFIKEETEVSETRPSKLQKLQKCLSYGMALNINKKYIKIIKTNIDLIMEDEFIEMVESARDELLDKKHDKIDKLDEIEI